MQLRVLDLDLDSDPIDFEAQLLRLTQGLSEDQAVMLFHRLRQHFGWSGTFFSADDIKELATDAWSEEYDTDIPDAKIAEITATVQASREWKRLPDKFAEIGNTIIADKIVGLV